MVSEFAHMPLPCGEIKDHATTDHEPTERPGQFNCPSVTGTLIWKMTNGESPPPSHKAAAPMEVSVPQTQWFPCQVHLLAADTICVT